MGPDRPAASCISSSCGAPRLISPPLHASGPRAGRCGVGIGVSVRSSYHRKKSSRHLISVVRRFPHLCGAPSDCRPFHDRSTQRSLHRAWTALQDGSSRCSPVLEWDPTANSVLSTRHRRTQAVQAYAARHTALAAGRMARYTAAARADAADRTMSAAPGWADFVWCSLGS